MTRGRTLAITGIVALVVLAVLAFGSIYVVDPTKNAVVLRFGQTINVTEEPGLYFKFPLIDNVVYIEKRLLDIDTPTVPIFASQQTRLEVDAFARYRVVDPLQFYTSTSSGNLAVANTLLSDILSAVVRDTLAASTFIQIVAEDRSNLMGRITETANATADAARLGVEIVDVRIRHADYPGTIIQDVFERMRTQRQTEAARIRADGEQIAREIRAQADYDVTVTLANANQQAETIRGDGDAQVNRIFAEAYGLDPDFFAFYRSMLAYQTALTPATTTLVLSPDSAFFRYFDQFGALGEDAAIVLPPVNVPEVEVPEVAPVVPPVIVDPVTQLPIITDPAANPATPPAATPPAITAPPAGVPAGP
jgi:membrane protease subunit HflC